MKKRLFYIFLVTVLGCACLIGAVHNHIKSSSPFSP